MHHYQALRVLGRDLVGLGLLTLPAVFVPARADHPPPAQAPASPADAARAQFDALKARYETALHTFNTAYERAGSPEAKAKTRETLYPDPSTYASEFLSLAKAHPESPFAFDALAWVVQKRDYADPSVNEALSLLKRNYLQSPRLAEVVPYLGTGYPGKETLLLLAIDASPHREVKGAALLTLANLRERKAETMRKFPQERESFEQVFGKERAERVAEAYLAYLDAQAEALRERAATEFGDVPYVGGPTVADRVRSGKFERDHLALGKPAPELAGEDIDGSRLKLSDYRGKVVLLSFWANWCGPCRDAFSHERAMVERYKGKPFVLLGINGDEDRETLKARVAEDGLTWRSFWDGADGPIARSWNVRGWPMFYVLDAEGIIRFKCDGHDAKGIDEAIERLLNEAGGAR